jgi:hypothetical protein
MTKPGELLVRKDTVTTSVSYRDSGPNRFLDIYINLECPACPDDLTPPGRLGIEDEAEYTLKYKSGDYVIKTPVATCLKCGYRACIGVYKGD